MFLLECWCPFALWAFSDVNRCMQVPAGVVSSAPEARMRTALAATGLEHAFQTVVTGDDVYRGRPDPEAYLFAAQQLGRPTVRCVVVGNSNQVRPCFLFHILSDRGILMYI